MLTISNERVIRHADIQTTPSIVLVSKVILYAKLHNTPSMLTTKRYIIRTLPTTVQINTVQVLHISIHIIKMHYSLWSCVFVYVLLCSQRAITASLPIPEMADALEIRAASVEPNGLLVCTGTDFTTGCISYTYGDLHNSGGFLCQNTPSGWTLGSFRPGVNMECDGYEYVLPSFASSMHFVIDLETDL